MNIEVYRRFSFFPFRPFLSSFHQHRLESSLALIIAHIHFGKEKSGLTCYEFRQWFSSLEPATPKRKYISKVIEKATQEYAPFNTLLCLCDD